MSFTQSCFIRKNTPELRNKLEELGYTYIQCGSAEWFIPIEELEYLVTYPTSGYYQGCNGYWHEDDFDCGDNENLFLALAALRDDSDYMQWFIHDVTKTKRLHGCFGQVIGMDGNYTEVVRREWILHEENNNQISDFIKHTKSFGDEPYVRKATVKEIIERFKTK